MKFNIGDRVKVVSKYSAKYRGQLGVILAFHEKAVWDFKIRLDSGVVIFVKRDEVKKHAEK